VRPLGVQHPRGRVQRLPAQVRAELAPGLVGVGPGPLGAGPVGSGSIGSGPVGAMRGRLACPGGHAGVGCMGSLK
jgi:hypothetical protein